MLSLSTAFKRLLENYILPYGTQSNTEEFREELASDAVRSVFQTHRLGLQRVFTCVTLAPTATAALEAGRAALLARPWQPLTPCCGVRSVQLLRVQRHVAEDQRLHEAAA